MKYLHLLLFVGCTFLWWSCEQSQRRKLVESAPLISQTLTDDTGKKIVLPNRPKRLISIAPNITEMIYAIGNTDKLVARSQACDHPEAALEKTAVTTYPTLDLEQIQALNPDLVITTDEIFSPDAIAHLEQLGVPIYQQSYQTLEDVYRCLEDLGTLLQAEARAREVADSLRTIVNKVEAETEDEVKFGTMVLISNDPLMVVGGKGFLHELIQKAGGKNVFADKTDAYHRTTVEEILQRAPEYIILPSNNDQIYSQLLTQYPYLQNTPADQQKHVFIINPDLVYRPGPRMVQGLLQMTNILHSSLNPLKFMPQPDSTSAIPSP